MGKEQGSSTPAGMARGCPCFLLSLFPLGTLMYIKYILQFQFDFSRHVAWDELPRVTLSSWTCSLNQSKYHVLRKPKLYKVFVVGLFGVTGVTLTCKS